MERKQSPIIHAPFCRLSWKYPAIFLIFGILSTFAWGFHLLRDHRADLAGLNTAPEEGIPFTDANVALALNAGLNPVETLVRTALVNIAGTRKESKTGVDTFVTVGSGVMIHPNGYVATAYHLLDSLTKIQVRVQTPNGPRQFSARVVKAVPEHDIVVIKLASRDVFAYLSLGDLTSLPPGSRVSAWGDPDGTQTIQRTGGVMARNGLPAIQVGKANLTHLVSTDAIYHWAQSGGPLVDDRGRLLGINLAIQDNTGQLRGYAVPVQILVNHFQDVVPFPNLPPNSNNTVGFQTPQSNTPGMIPVAATQMVAAPLPSSRPADGWWRQAQNFLTSSITLDTPSPNNTNHGPTQRIMGYPLPTFVGLLVLGFISGISGGMMTMGGGIIKVTGLMSIFGYGLLLVRPVAYITNIFMYGAAALRYRRDNLYNWEVVRPMVPWAMAGVVIGYAFGNILETKIINYLLGAFAFLLCIKMLVELAEAKKDTYERVNPIMDQAFRILGSGQPNQKRQAHSEENYQNFLLRDGILGLPMGIISGILGITGGVIEVPLQRYVGGIPLRNAIANSAVLVFFASLMGSLVAMVHGVQSGAFEATTPLIMALILIPGAYTGGFFGAWLTTVVPLYILRWFYAFLMFTIAARMFLI
ncbi:MAG: TSUP family transporter [Magnetococcus sp. DMHC-6]